MALAFDVAMTRTVQFAVATYTTATATIAATANRLAAIGTYHATNTATGITASCGGTSGSLISGTDTGTTKSLRTFLHGVIAPTSGVTKSATVSWTGNRDCYGGCAVFNGGDQVTGFSNGGVSTGATGAPSITPTSGNAGDMSVACLAAGGTASATQTAVTASLNGTTQDFQMTRGNQGATHSWADSFSDYCLSGAVVKQDSGAAGGLPFFMQGDLLSGYKQANGGGFQ